MCSSDLNSYLVVETDTHKSSQYKVTLLLSVKFLGQEKGWGQTSEKGCDGGSKQQGQVG